MALTSTLFTGLSGLDVNQARLNVVGNNIANVNTVAFKSSRTIFTPQFYVTDNAGSPSDADFGGQNPSQRGLGATVGAIQKDFSGGAIEPTGRVTDLAIDGEGFFVVKRASGTKYTRDGSFSLNANNELVTAAGDFVQGYSVDSNNKINTGTLDKIRIPVGTVMAAQATKNVAFQGNLSTSAGGASVLNSVAITTVGGTTKPTGATLLTDLALQTVSGNALFNVGDQIPIDGTKGGQPYSGTPFDVTDTSTLQDLLDYYNTQLGIATAAPSGAGIPRPGASIKDDATPPVPSDSAVQIVISGNVGAANTLSVDTGPFGFTEGTTGDIPPIASNPNGQQVKTTFQAYDSIGNPLTVNLTATLDSIGPAGTTWKFTATSPDNVIDPTAVIGSGMVQFDTTGKFVAAVTPNVSISRQNTGAVTPQLIKIDFSDVKGLQDAQASLKNTSQDGFPSGRLASFAISAQGIVTGSFTNGLNQTLGQVAIATFKNPEGLIDDGGNMYEASAGSGLAIVGVPQQLGAGSVRAGALELSNVDLSKEFTNLIVATTGFSAASKVITTSDQLIQELLNTAR
jgi:flagellar hook protein FlgE